MHLETKQYELAYLLSSTIPEREVLTYAGKLTTLIEELHGIIGRVEEPKKRRLAYPVKKEQNAYFGWTIFTASPEITGMLKKKLRGEEKFLRHLLVEREMETAPQTFRMLPRRRPAPFAVKPMIREEIKPEEKLDLEALDKKLEEILGK